MKERIENYFKENYSTLVKRFNRRAGGVENAEDVIQDAFEAALRYSDTYKEGEDFAKWFGTIANNALRRFKSNDRLGGMTIEFDETYAEGVDLEGVNDSLIKKIKDEIKQRAPLVEKVLTMHYFQGYAPRDIAKVLDLSNPYIRNLIYKFKNEMAETYGIN